MGNFEIDELIAFQIAEYQEDDKSSDNGIQENEKKVVETVPPEFDLVISLVREMDHMGKYQERDNKDVFAVFGDTFGSGDQPGMEPEPEGDVETQKYCDKITDDMVLG